MRAFEQSLAQIRAENALIATGRNTLPNSQQRITAVEEKAVTRLPAMIVNNGLLAAAAFAQDKDEKLRNAMDAVARHLADSRIARLSRQSTTAAALISELASSPSENLRLASAEALAYLSFLKRFAVKADKEG